MKKLAISERCALSELENHPIYRSLFEKYKNVQDDPDQIKLVINEEKSWSKLEAFIHYYFCYKNRHIFKNLLYSPYDSTVLRKFTDKPNSNQILQNFVKDNDANQFYSALKTSSTSGLHDRLVIISLFSLESNIRHMWSIFDGDDDENKNKKDHVIASLTPITFDPSPMEWLLFLMRPNSSNFSTTLLLIENENSIFLSNKLTEILSENSVTIIPQITPSLFKFHHRIQQILEKCGKTLDYLIFGGEAFVPRKLIGDYVYKTSNNNSLKIYNFYGQTELSCWASFYQLREQDFLDDKLLPLGKLMPETEILMKIVDRNDEFAETAESQNQNKNQINPSFECIVKPSKRRNLILDLQKDGKIQALDTSKEKFPTGDYFEFRDGNFCFLGRSRVVKD